MTDRALSSLLWGAAIAYLLTAFRLWDAWPAHWGDTVRGETGGAALLIAVVLFAIGVATDAYAETR